MFHAGPARLVRCGTARKAETMKQGLNGCHDVSGWDRSRMTTFAETGISRRGLLGIFAATVVTAAPTMSKAFGILRGAGDIRRLHMHNARSGETLNTVYWIQGEYVREVLAEVDHFFRDMRTNSSHRIDTRTLDILAAAHNLLDVSEPYLLLSGYRSPETNAALRSRSRGVARNSRHMVGQAADVRLGSRSVGQVSRAAIACAAGGVGRYSRSNFTHMDCGPVRSWGA